MTKVYMPSLYGEILYELALEKGACSSLLLNGTKIDESLLRSQSIRITTEQFAELITRAMELTNDPNLGLIFGSRLTVTTHGQLALAALSANSLGNAIELLTRYFHIRFPMVALQFFIEKEEAVLQLDVNFGDREQSRFLTEALFSALSIINKQFFDNKISDTGSCLFAYPNHGYIAKYKEIIHGNLIFNHSVNQLRFRKAVLNLPMQLANPVVLRIAEKECESLLHNSLKHNDFIHQVNRVLQANSRQIPSMEQVADTLLMSSRTLRRKLDQFNISFQTLRDEVCKRRAIDLLRHTDKTVDEIGYLLGYSDASNFGRAFRKWTGKSPSMFRE